MVELIHVSDLHFGRPKRNAKKLLDLIEKKFAFKEGENRFLLVTGDITDDGEVAEYKTAKAELSRFSQFVFVVPGNHDYGAFGAYYDPPSAKRFDSELSIGLGMGHRYFKKKIFLRAISQGNGAEVLVIGLNSCSKTAFFFDLAEGVIGKDQLDELKTVLDDPQYEDVPKVILLHHIPHRPATGVGMSLRDYKQLMEVVKDKASVVAFGHQGDMEAVSLANIAKHNLDAANRSRVRKIKKQAPIRAMKLRSGKAQGIKYYLDANQSVPELTCYQINISQGSVRAKKIVLA